VFRAAWWSALAVIFLLCTMLLARRIAGELRQPVQGEGLIALGLVAAGLASLLRLARVSSPVSPPDWRDRAERLAAPGLCVLFFGTAVSLPGSPAWALSIFWCTLIAAESLWWYFTAGLSRPVIRWPQRRRVVAVRSAPSPLPAGFRELGIDAADMIELSDEEEELEPSLPAKVTQQFTRLLSEPAGETLVGLVRAGFAGGERSQNVHLAFCPPFEGTPVLHAEQIEGPSVSIKAAQVESYGARLELKLAARSDESESVIIRFQVCWTPQDDAHPSPDRN
jgi:hypothetical protein